MLLRLRKAKANGKIVAHRGKTESPHCANKQ
jgi:hypothetical protein